MKYNKEQLENIIKDSLSISDVCRKLGLKTVGGNYKTIKTYIKKYSLDISHFTGQSWNKGKNYTYSSKKYAINDIFIENSTYTNLYRLKKKLIFNGLKEYVCEKCGLTEWNGQLLSLHLDHKNGNNLDHRLENLQFLCPNCHSLTTNYCGKSKGISYKNELSFNRYLIQNDWK